MKKLHKIGLATLLTLVSSFSTFAQDRSAESEGFFDRQTIIAMVIGGIVGAVAGVWMSMRKKK